MKTSKQWLSEVKQNPEKFNRWLSRQYRAEVEAAERIAVLAVEAEPKHKQLLLKISADETKHAKLLEGLCSSRGIGLGAKEPSRYYHQVDISKMNRDEVYAAGHYAEGMRLARIKAIVEDGDIDQDIRSTFEIILVDEEMHEKAFGAISSVEAKANVKTMHDKGVKALGLVI